MAHIELPRALEDYFAFAETTPTRNGRRFVISLPYFCGPAEQSRLDRLQWWFHVRPEQERQMGEAAIATLRAQASERFVRHIERWLENTRQVIHGEEPIPRVDSIDAARPAAMAPSPPTPELPAPPAEASATGWPAEKVANG
jgi:hypothetical protein